MLAASRQRVNAARACAGLAPASPQAGVITACAAQRGQRQPQPLPEPDDPLGGLAGPGLTAAGSSTRAFLGRPARWRGGRGR